MKLKRICASILVGTLLNGFALNANAELKPNVNEKLILTKEEQLDPNYSYIIPDGDELILNDEEQILFNKVVQSIINNEEVITLSDNDDSNNKVLNAIYNSIYNLAVKHTDYSPTTKQVTITYVENEYTTIDRLTYIENEMNKLYSNLFKDDMSTYDKFIMLYYYAQNNFGYYIQYPREFVISNHEALKIPLDYLLRKRKAVCHTYSEFLDYFCQTNNIESYLIIGYACKTLHMWNLIKIDDKYYYFDITNAIQTSIMLKNSMTSFGMNKMEFQMYDYSIPDKYKIKGLDNVEMGDFYELRQFDTLEYLGNHTYKLTTKFKEVKYYNSETRIISDNLEDIQTKKKTK